MLSKVLARACQEVVSPPTTTDFGDGGSIGYKGDGKIGYALRADPSPFEMLQAPGILTGAYGCGTGRDLGP